MKLSAASILLLSASYILLHMYFFLENGKKNQRISRQNRQMAKKQSVAKLKKKLDTIFSRWLRLSSADHRGICTCFTCGAEKHWKEIHAGHFMSRKHNATRWHLDNVKPQCPKCNLFSQGEQYQFSQNLGEDIANEMYQLSRITCKLNAAELQEEIKRYTELFNELT